MIGTTELVLLSGLALLLFGGKKLPEMMRGLGQGVKEFKKGMKDISETDKQDEDNTHPTKDISEPIEKETVDESVLVDDGEAKE